MKKVFCAILMVVFTAPTWASISITATDLGSGVVAIDYNGVDLARAFALDIIVDTGVITDINEYAIGEDNFGYGIFPANFSRYITVLETGEVENWFDPNYTPVADVNDPGALGGIDTNGITIEMGSLYDVNAPLLSGRLCTVTVSESCLLSVTTNAIRGNVVLEDANEAIVDLTGATDVQVTIGETYTGANPEQWVAVGQPLCWVASINPRQCHGDADGVSQGKNNYWVSTNDLEILIGAWNKPLSSLTGNQICADFDHLPQGKQNYRVSTNDLDILIANWNQANAPVADCP
ncbi:MAG: hypothetical protein JXA96_17010 [Sedimentisphaerales bacterium]|nr:hypothetical protein [Sedimentisphaerales bacterium]